MSAARVYKRGDVYIASLDPQKGSEQGGTRPVLILQTDWLNRVGNTVIVIPFTTNVRRAKLPSSLLVPKDEGGLSVDSVALCHKIRVLDKSGLQSFLGSLSVATLKLIEQKVRFTLGM